MGLKRPLHDEEPEMVAYKHPREQDNTARQSVIVQVSPGDDTPPKPLSGDDSFIQAEEKKTIGGDLFNEENNGDSKEFGAGSSYLWVNNNGIDEYVDSDAAVYFSVFPHYLEFDRRVRALVRSDDIYSDLLERSPSKVVPVGPDHQADIPEWLPYDKTNSENQKFTGTCIIPMPELESPAYTPTGSNCDCLDQGSVRCVRQHIMEARDRLREEIGEAMFEKLGLSDMGEDVARRWSVEDEISFHEIVQSNPASQAKNFWDHLFAFFLTRKKSDIVSYYFNVFVLRKRNEQNRFDPLNADSDNDEWQISEEITEDDDEGSVVVADESLFDPVSSNPNNLDNVENTGNCDFHDVLQVSSKKLNNTGEESYENDMGNDGRIVVKSGGHN